jgi:RNase P/RNase MRP subunit POP5
MKLKGRPTLRENKRYVFFKVHSAEGLDYRVVKDGIMNSLINWLGDKDLALAKPWMIKNLWDQKTQSGVLQCSHTYVEDVKVSLGLIHQIGESKNNLNIIKDIERLWSSKNSRRRNREYSTGSSSA